MEAAADREPVTVAAATTAIDRARDLLRAGRSVTTFSGAGLSAESGIATFRDKHDPNALWAKFDPMELASPEGFARHPEVVRAWYAWRREGIARAQPNPAHRALAERDDLLHITQNVDDLLERAGASIDRVVHLHGEIAIDRCHARCGYEARLDLARGSVTVEACPKCAQPVRPGVVWFGEMLPADAWQRAEHACRSCEVLLVIGTSGVVYPAAGLVMLAKSAGARIVIVNTESSGASELADIELLGPAGEIVPRLLAE